MRLNNRTKIGDTVTTVAEDGVTMTVWRSVIRVTRVDRRPRDHALLPNTPYYAEGEVIESSEGGWAAGTKVHWNEMFSAASGEGTWSKGHAGAWGHILDH